MSHGPDLDRLVARWAEEPRSTCFAALAEGLRKLGDLDEALTVAVHGVEARPDFVPGRVTLARVYRDRDQMALAESELQAALALDPDHPVVLAALEGIRQHAVPASKPAGTHPDAAAHLAPTGGSGRATLAPREPIIAFPDDDEESTELVYTDTLLADHAEPPAQAVITESLAMLYHGQGHVDQALTVLDALCARNPDDTALAGRRAAMRAERDALHPPPYQASRSGGRSVHDWLAAVAAVKADRRPAVSSFDAFYQAPATPVNEATDLAAFQAWLKELDR